ncbi:TlpA family protein disulfide reductase [Spongiibacter sp. KMU-166]|uniref:TlpA family protein disulfide reductase n=1 Tax=Spongiibacter thalassae TaxID=2721624 RepID=A0ABX1GL79_9GAMM|nr:TlpA disulfide reductase family protein [Spongiibacter thalassae]NKI19238.1 TlpA family protein disulfide reductase [Spongiibacter thalassae]
MNRILPSLTLVAALTVSAMSHALTAGDKAPYFRGPLITAPANAELFDSQSLKGKVVYIDFWASWCGPCRVSLPALNTLYQEFSEQGFHVVAINVDSYRDDALSFLKERPVDYPVIYDAGQKLPGEFGVKGMPTAFLLDRSGTVHHVHEGFRPGDEQALRGAITKLLKEEAQ